MKPPFKAIAKLEKTFDSFIKWNVTWQIWHTQLGIVNVNVCQALRHQPHGK